jgi:transposase
MSFAIALSDAQWELVADLFDPPGRRGAPAQIPRRQMVEALLFIGRTGCQWRYLPERYGTWTAVWAQWRRWRSNGVWARAMERLAAIVRVLHDREPTPSMVMVDAQTVKGGRYGPTFHEAGGRGGRTIGTKRTLLVEILRVAARRSRGLRSTPRRRRRPRAPARPTGRSPERPGDRRRPGLPGPRGARRAQAPRARHQGAATGCQRLRPDPAALPDRARVRRSSGAGAASRAATRAPQRAPGPGSRWRRSAISPGARQPDLRRTHKPRVPGLPSLGRSVPCVSDAARHPALEAHVLMPTSASGISHPTPRRRINRRVEFGYRP